MQLTCILLASCLQQARSHVVMLTLGQAARTRAHTANSPLRYWAGLLYAHGYGRDYEHAAHGAEQPQKQHWVTG